MAKYEFWCGTISTSSNSSIACIMCRYETRGILAALYKVVTKTNKNRCSNLCKDKKEKEFKKLDNESWWTKINTKDVPIYALMFRTEQRRNEMINLFKTLFGLFDSEAGNTAKEKSTDYRTSAPDSFSTIDDNSITAVDDETTRKHAVKPNTNHTSKTSEVKPEPIKIELTIKLNIINNFLQVYPYINEIFRFFFGS